jgi:hypothetical protein
VVAFGFPTTHANELAMDCVGVRAKGVNANGLILAIGLGKFKSVLCVYEPSEPSRQTAGFATSQALLQVLVKYRPSVVVIEALSATMTQKNEPAAVGLFRHRPACLSRSLTA